MDTSSKDSEKQTANDSGFLSLQEEDLSPEKKKPRLNKQTDDIVKFADKLGLTPYCSKSLKEEWEELDYYPDIFSHFISMLWHMLQGTEVITESTDISKILQDVGFNLKTSNHLHNAILDDTFDLSIFQWVNYYVREILVDEDSLPSWLLDQGNQAIGDSFIETISLSDEHCLKNNGQTSIKITATWLGLEGIISQIEEIEDANSGSGTDKYWYHCTSPNSANNILQDGVTIKQYETLVHLGHGFYVSNNFSSVSRYIQKTWRMCPKVPSAIIFVFKWDETKQEKFRDRLLDLVTVDKNDPERTREKLKEKTKDIIEFNRRKFIKRHMDLHDLEKEKSLILAVDTKDGKEDEATEESIFCEDTDLQMCIKDKDAAKEFTQSLKEIFLLSKKSYDESKSLIDDYKRKKKAKLHQKAKEFKKGKR